MNDIRDSDGGGDDGNGDGDGDDSIDSKAATATDISAANALPRDHYTTMTPRTHMHIVTSSNGSI